MNLIRIILPLLGLLAIAALVGVEAGREKLGEKPLSSHEPRAVESPATTPSPDATQPGPSRESREAWFSEILNPSHTCPHCRMTYSENRSMLMLLIGFLGQLFFTSRFLVQWIASERRKRSYVPRIFWYLSIVGSLLLFTYAVSILAWPVILGQALGILVYSRNLSLIHRQATAREGIPSKPAVAGERGTGVPGNAEEEFPAHASHQESRTSQEELQPTHSPRG
ncbi:MAG: lipid-A-disaccharide synthase N-terminal domain-containing protein [Planctomycetota bacterium]|jgi:lipid-A-disaccharide synthase-like uncharacterized protein